MKTLPIVSTLGLGFALASSLYFSQMQRPFHQVGVKFCPSSVNYDLESQERLNKKYCRDEQVVLKEIWEGQNLSPEIGYFQIRQIPATESKALWLLLAPISAGISLLAWQAKSEQEENEAHKQLEFFKTTIKLTTVSATEERDFKKETIKNTWDKQRVKAGFISVEAMQDKFDRQSEIQNKTHAAALKQLDSGLAEMQKTISENRRDAAKADKERDKILGIKSNISEENKSTAQLKQEEINLMIEALKNHEDGWLWKILKASKPIWIIGEQGTGKTNTSVAFALIRKHCLGIPIYRIADRHLLGANNKVWNLLEAEVKADNDSAIMEALEDAYERRLDRIGQDLPDDKAEQFILDEFTHLKDINEEVVKKFIKSTFSDTRKAKERFIGVTHLGTNEAFGDGTAAMRKAGSILIEKFTADGEKPLPRVVIRHGLVDEAGNKLEDEERSLPQWLRAEIIHAHFNGKPIEF